MFKHIVADPDAVKAMAAAMKAYCEAHGLTGEVDKQAVATRVIGLYSGGHKTKAALIAALRETVGKTAS